MKRAHVILGFLPGLLGLWTSTARAELELSLMHTRPICHYSGHSSAYCKASDSKRVARESGMEDAVREMLDLAQDPATAKITIAYFSFSNKAVFDKLCEKGKAGFQIEGFFDNDYNSEDAMPGKLVEKCQNEDEPGNVQAHFLGEKKIKNDKVIVWRLHHNKFFIVDPGKKSPVKISFSSGNLSNYGLSLHFDHWVTVTAPRKSSFLAQHGCVIEALRDSLDPEGTGEDQEIDDPQMYRKSLDRCLKRVGVLSMSAALQQEGIYGLFSPNPKQEIEKTLIREIEKMQEGDAIDAAMQNFTHVKIARALTAAVERGVKVRLIMDDDVAEGTSEVPGVTEFFNKEILAKGIQLRVMETNGDDVRPQMMHQKFVVFMPKGQEWRVFSGAGHFTYSAMRNNYENFYLSRVPSLSKEYRSLFDFMWKMGLEPEGNE